MKLYFSGWFAGSDNYLNRELIKRNAYRLCSFAYPTNATVYLDIAEELGIRANIMIDSGAFTAWTQGKPIQLDSLIQYAKDLLAKYGERHNFIFISLDVMPGEKGRYPTESELQSAMSVSYTNYLEYQQELGANYEVLPVYHSGEPLSFKQKFLNKTNHICLSMNQDMSEKNRVEWANRNQVDGVKLHGLAATGPMMVKYVDWYSVDSAGWIMAAAMGSILWPLPDGRLPSINVSVESPAKKKYNTHLENFTMQSAMQVVIESKGYTLEQLTNDPMYRMKWNMDVWLSHKWAKKKHVQKGFFDE